MNFIEFKNLFQKHLDKMTDDSILYCVSISDREEFWNLYLDSFPKGYNEIYKERREFDCNCCKSFFKHYGGIVQIKNNKLISIWDIANLKTPFKEVCKALSDYVKLKEIVNVFLYKQLFETNSNKQLLDNGKVITWDHLYYRFPEKFKCDRGKTLETTLGIRKTSKNMFKRSMEELTLDAGESILELIEQNSLYRGEEFKGIIHEFIQYKKEYNKLKSNEKDNWCWANSNTASVARIRNTAIGTLLIDISNKVDLNEAVRKFESVVAPTNYKRPKPIFTKKMVEHAEEKIKELGFEESLGRRYASLKDITVNNILFVNRDVKRKLKDSIFDKLKEEVVTDSKKFNKIEEVNIEDFIKNVLPTTKSLEVMLERNHKPNLVSLIAPINMNSKTMFKWDNNFSWAYIGDIADSIKQNVKNAGGNVEGVLRFSIQWNEDGKNNNDFDAHAIEPKGEYIYYANCKKPEISKMTGQLDVDIIEPNRQRSGQPAVENITWTNIHKMNKGIYKFLVHNYTHRDGRTGFSAEIEFNGQIYYFEYPHELKPNEKVNVANVILNDDNTFSIKNILKSTVNNIVMWNVSTNQFIKVNVMSYSPNYWDEQTGMGNKHYFFFLDKCINDGALRGFFNEFLNEKLTPYRKVFEALGSKMRVQETENQLSGIGFSSTQRNSLLARVEGTTKRIIKILF